MHIPSPHTPLAGVSNARLRHGHYLRVGQRSITARR